MCDETTFARLQRETLKFMEIDNVFNRLKRQGFLDRIYLLANDIFNAEHEFTIKELFRLAESKNIKPADFNLREHYKLNSHIFKQNLTLVCGIVIEDVWVNFNKLMMEQELQLKQSKLFRIDEDEQLENCNTEELDQNRLQKENLSDRHAIKTSFQKIIEEVQKNNSLSPKTQGSQSHRVIQSQSRHTKKSQSITSSPKKSSYQNQNTIMYLEKLSKNKQKQFFSNRSISNTQLNNSKSKSSKSEDVKVLIDQINTNGNGNGSFSAAKYFGKNNQINLQGLIQKMSFQPANFFLQQK